jgi:hypothetical protein
VGDLRGALGGEGLADWRQPRGGVLGQLEQVAVRARGLEIPDRRTLDGIDQPSEVAGVLFRFAAWNSDTESAAWTLLASNDAVARSLASLSTTSAETSAAAASTPIHTTIAMSSPTAGTAGLRPLLALCADELT